ncbi:MAG: cytochrome c [Gammaproteobacteria bacterium]|nr:cytochrome c [Gammaproteobacteria bacterium]
MNLQFIFATMAIVCVSTQVAMAGDSATGERAYLAKACIGCHGPAGKSANPDIYPNIAGKEAAYLVEQMKAFRAGTRANPLMTPMAAGLTDDDIANLAVYLSAQK